MKIRRSELMLVVDAALLKIKQKLCRHKWEYNNQERNKTCTKCHKCEEVFMGWV